MFDQALNNLIVCLMISHKLHTKLHKRAGMLQWLLSRVGLSKLISNETSEKNLIKEGPFSKIPTVSCVTSYCTHTNTAHE